MHDEDMVTHETHGDKQEQHTDISETQDTHGVPGNASPTSSTSSTVTMSTITPQQEIRGFVDSKQAGMISSFTKSQLWRAAETLYTANGLNCPVRIEYINGETVLINREIYDKSN